MVLKDLLAISGEQGLFKFIAQGKNAIIVEHLETGKRTSAFSSAKVSSLEEISVFTEKEDLPLGKVFDRIFEKESGGPAIDSKVEPEELKKYFEEIVPDYSREKVYVSDIRKIVLWYNILLKKDMLVKEEPEKKEEAGKEEEPKESVPGTSTAAPEKKKKKAPASGTKSQKPKK
jgi:Domain of unknown function (DUF6852)/Domain of unknown function (DUF5606)